MRTKKKKKNTELHCSPSSLSRWNAARVARITAVVAQVRPGGLGGGTEEPHGVEDGAVNRNVLVV